MITCNMIYRIMNSKKKLVLVVKIVFFLALSTKIYAKNNDFELSGTLQLDSVWAPVVYLSYIQSFDHMNTISNDMIIAESKVKSNGCFSFRLDFLPEEEGLYRLHVSKRGSSAASIIIGGNEHNHMFLILNRKSNVRVNASMHKSPFRKITISKSDINQSIYEINRIASYKDSTEFGISKMKREFIRKAIDEKLRFIADTSSHSLTSLYALYKSDFESNYPLNPKFYSDYLKKWGGQNSNYFKAFKDQMPKVDKSNNFVFYSIGIVCFLLGFSTNYLLRGKENKLNKRLQALSVQERKVFSLIQLGKSNKEISEECNIELSTVKSHVSNIYAKLKIKSRKEALEFRL